MVAENSFYKNIIDNLPEGVAVCDADQFIIAVNRNFEKLTGFLEQDLIGKNISEYIKSAKTGCYKCSKEAEIIESNTPKSYYIGELIDSEHRSTCIRINSSITKDDKTIYLVIPLADVAFLNRAHIDFVSTVSHELRTPLTSIKGFADTLLSSGDRLSEEQQKRFLSIIKGQVDRLTRLVENLLTVSKLESKKDKSIYKAIELTAIFKKILNNIHSKAHDHKIEIKLPANIPPIWIDSDKLEQIMINLVDNAIKYSNAGTKVTIEAKFLSENTDSIQINVTDQGVGIPEEYIPTIFNKFSRIDNPLTRQVEGTGLGLYITKSLVENMGGKISVKSSNEGSTFSIIFPVATHEKPAQARF